MQTTPIAPTWVVLPLAMLALIVCAGHLIALREAPPGAIPANRRRIRTITGWVIMFTVPLTAYAFGIVTPADPGMFLLSWMAVTGLLLIIIVLAGIDLLETHRLHRADRRKIRRELAEARQRALIRSARAGDHPRDGGHG